ncbi:MAG: Multidrug resistance protein MdtA [Phycisphaerae bacterium]|nr:Multidrug resistance protein MdtA [Phycisphaerae bacterium]
MNASADLAVLGGKAMPPAATVALAPPRRQWKTRILLPGTLLTAAAGMLAMSARDALVPARAVTVVPVVAKAGGAAGRTISVQAPGWVEADPFYTAVPALADGVVKEVLVLEGERVEAGQVVARLVDDDARLALSRAEAEAQSREGMLASAEAALQAAQTNWDHPVELRRKLAAAEAMLAERRAALQRWPSELAKEQAYALELKADFELTERLFRQNEASEIEFVRAKQKYEAQAAQAAATAALKPVLEAQLASAEADVTAATEALQLRVEERRMLDASQAEVRTAKAALDNARAALGEARLRLERMEVRAPSAGIVMARLVEPGSKVMLLMDAMRSSQIVRLYDPQKLQVRVDVPLAEAAHVGVGQDAEVVVLVLPDRTFKGHVTRLVHEADIQKNTLQVKVAIVAPAAEIKPEMLARVRFMAAAPTSGAASREALFIPAGLLRERNGDQAQVWLADQARNVAEYRRVQVGAAKVGDWLEIADGLRSGDRLIADDTSGLRPGERVRITGESRAFASSEIGGGDGAD